VATEKCKRYKSPGVDQLPTELFQARRKTLCSVINKLIKLICNKEKSPDQCRANCPTYTYKD
jgi:hypothetical protein